MENKFGSLHEDMGLFLRFLSNDRRAKEKMPKNLREVYEKFEREFDRLYHAAGGITITDEEVTAIKKKIANEIPQINEAYKAYMDAMESVDEEDGI